MKRENIYVGMRVKVKHSCDLGCRGEYATVCRKPFDRFDEVFVDCFVDGCSEWTLNIDDIKISDEAPVVGDRIVVVQAEPSQGGKYYENGASGIVRYIDEEGDPKVIFDRGEYREQVCGGWYIQKDLGQKYAIVRNVEGLK